MNAQTTIDHKKLNAANQPIRCDYFVIKILGREKITELLIQNDANIDPVDDSLWAPLVAAASNGKKK